MLREASNVARACLPVRVPFYEDQEFRSPDQDPLLPRLTSITSVTSINPIWERTRAGGRRSHEQQPKVGLLIFHGGGNRSQSRGPRKLRARASEAGLFREPLAQGSFCPKRTGSPGHAFQAACRRRETTATAVGARQVLVALPSFKGSGGSSSTRWLGTSLQL